MIRRIRKEFGRAGCSDRTAVRRATSTRRWVWRRTDTSPPECDRRTTRPATWPAVDAVHGSAPLRFRARDPGRTPHAAVWRCREDRECTCTTGLRPERAALPPSGVRTRGALGCARSSRQLVTALVAACLQHCAAGPGAHPLAETMLLGTTAVIGLVGALHAALLELHSAALTGRQQLRSKRRPTRSGNARTACKTRVARHPVATEPRAMGATGAAVRRRPRSLLRCALAQFWLSTRCGQ